MADYREISQEYARGAINATILVNGGAAVALLSQAAELVKQGLAGNIKCAMVSWALGVFVGAATWIPAFLSTRFVDRSERAASEKARRNELNTSDRWLYVGTATVAGSLILFMIGCISLAYGLP
jgi:hypothetical protein